MDETERPTWEPPAAPDPTAPIEDAPGAFARLGLAFTAPGRLFDATARRPQWAVCLVALMLVALASQIVALPHLDMEATLRERFEKSGREVDEERIEQMAAQAQRTTFIYPIIAVVAVPVVMALIAGIFLGALKLAGSDADYSRSLAVTVHSYWPGAIVTNGLFVILVQRVDKLSATALQNLVKGSAAAFLPVDAPAWQAALGSSLSVFNLWIIALLVLGMSTVGRISRAAATTVVLVPWVLYVLGKTVLAAVVL